MSQPTKILVTGGTGFLGAYIIKQLVNSGYSVRSMSRNNVTPFFISPDIFNKVEWIKGDVLDIMALEEAMDGIDTVIHAAAKVSFAADSRKEMFQTNISGTTNVVDTALAQNVKRFVHISSVASLGRTSDGVPADESKAWVEHTFHTNYAISKYRAEMEVWRAIGEGLNAVIVNPSTIIGYGDWNTSSCAIFKSVYSGFPWFTNGSNGFTDVEDIAKAVVMLMESDIAGERFLLNGDNWSYRRLFDTIADGFGKPHPSREATPFLGAIAWRIERWKSFLTNKHPLLTKETASIAQSSTMFDSSKIKKFLPGLIFTPLEETIQKACAAYLHQVKQA